MCVSRDARASPCKSWCSLAYLLGSVVSPWSLNTWSKHFWNWIQVSGFPLLKYGTETLYVGDPTSVRVVRHLNVCTECFPLSFDFRRSKGIGGLVCDKQFMVLGTKNFILEAVGFVACFCLLDHTILVILLNYKV